MHLYGETVAFIFAEISIYFLKLNNRKCFLSRATISTVNAATSTDFATPFAVNFSVRKSEGASRCLWRGGKIPQTS